MALGTTLDDHVSNGDCAERSEVKTSQCDVFADEGSTRKHRNREYEEVPLGTTLDDHVSNGDCAERSEVKTSQCDVFRPRKGRYSIG